MKQETNNDIDLLLRRMIRRNGDSMGDAHTEIDDRHLDADELSSYAQNALPRAARARYTEHLAECSRCRKLVTQLALSLGSTAPAAETVLTPGGLKALLASLFSPMVLRYAVPALGLIIVAAIGFIVMKQRSPGSLTARVEPQPSHAEPAETPEGFVAAPILKDNSKEEGVKADSQNPQKPATEQSRDAAPKGAIDSVGTGSVHAKEPQTEAEAPAPAAATPSPEAAKAMSAEAQKREDAAGAKKDEEAVAKKQSSPAEGVPTVASASREQRNEAQGAFVITPSPQNKATPAPSEQRGLLAPRARKSPGTAQDKYENTDRTSTGETRSVAGRNFRKERGIWIDTEYDSSTQTVNMARGSEQFRALVADEPTIGTIAKQLDGEVIVVWKGRAYRIR